MKKIKLIIAIFAICMAANAQTLDRSVQPKPAPAHEINIKDAQTFTLDNGLKVFVVEDHKLPQVYYSFMFDIDPQLYGGKTGTTDVFSVVAGTGTTSKNKDELNKAFDMLGANFDFSNESAYVSGLTKYRPQMVELFADVLLNPKFTEEELDLGKSQIKSGLKYITSDANAMSQISSSALMFGKNHPYGEVTTAKTVDSIGISDLENYYKTYIAPNNARLAIVGDIDLATAKAEVEKYFGAWQKHDVPQHKWDVPQAPAKARVAFINKDEAVQSVVAVCYPINFKPYNDDMVKTKLAAHILGGGASGRLFQNLREKHGYTYGCYNEISDNDVVGYYKASASVKAEVTDSAVAQILFEMNRIVDTAVTQKELDAAKAFFMGDFGRSLQRPGTIAGFAIAIEKYNLPADYFKNYTKMIDAVTIDDVKAAAKKYICPQNAWIVVVGDKAQASKLKKFTADNNVEFYDLYGNADKAAGGFDSTIYYLICAVVVLLLVWIMLNRAAKRKRRNRPIKQK